jgi:PD-(D/E)XK nuclease superfamily
VGKKQKKAKQLDEPAAETVHVITSLGMPEVRPLYPHPDTGQAILTNSMLTAFRRCIKQSEFKYVHRLKPKRLGSPLKRGTWVHKLLEVDAKGEDWRKEHKRLSRKFNEMFDEEKDFYGDMPTEILRVMKAYFWHYKHDPWKYHEVELELTAELPNGVLLRIKFDGLIENQWGLWLVDHKSHKTLPNTEYRLLDTQSPLYIWVAHQNGIPVNGFIWNYLKWKAPTVPKLVYASSSHPRLSKTATETDYPTLRKALKDYGLDASEYADRLAYYKSLRYSPGEPQNSPFFFRSVYEKDEGLIGRVLKEAMRSAERMNTYDFSDPEAVERTVGRHCQFMCSYTDLCTMQLLGGNTRPLIRQNYKEGDPMDYYHDRVGDGDNKEDND